MSLFKLLLRMFNLLRNSKHSSCYHICRAWGVHFIWFIRLDNVQWFSLGKSEHSDIAEISWYILYVYIYIRYVVDIVLLCECTDLLSRGMWCGSTRTPWEHWTGAADCRWPPGPCHSAVPEHRTQGGHRRLKTSQMLWWRLLLLLCHSMSWFTLCSNLRDAFFPPKMIHSSQQLGLDSEGKTGGCFCEQNSELKRRWIFQKALTYLEWGKASSEDLGGWRGCSECQTQMLKCTF